MVYVLYVIHSVLLFFANISISEAHSWRCDYTYVKKANAYLKFHKIPATWRDARLRCQDEGAMLASPYTEDLIDAMLNHMWEKNSSRPILTGLHATFSKGDYYTVDGIPLSKIPITWFVDEPNSYKDAEDCLILTVEGFGADKKCDDPYPYFCYKDNKRNDDIYLSSCGTSDSEYEYSDVTRHCYKFHKVPRVWSRAHMACSSEGGHLVIINSEQEAQVIRDIWARTPPTLMIGDFLKEFAFLGIHNRFEHFDWKTIQGETLTEAGYDKFAKDMPRREYYCGTIGRNGMLYDADCNVPFAFICEKDPNSLMCLDERQRHLL